MYDLLFHAYAANCGVPKPPGNGTIVNYTGTVEGSTLLYQCNSGFGPVGEMTAVCAADGRWSPDPADVSCREIGMQMAIIHAIHQVVLNCHYRSAVGEWARWHMHGF